MWPFDNSSNPANAAQPYLQQIGPTMSPYFAPWINAGKQALPDVMNQYQNLLTNPGGMLNQIGQGYHQSPGYQFQFNQALGGANRAAAAGGMLGSPQEQQNMAGTAQQLANSDYYNYLDKATGMYGAGLSGMQGINQMGYGASDELAEGLAKALTAQANNAYAGQVNQNQAQGSLFGKGLGFLGGMFGGFGNNGSNGGGMFGSALSSLGSGLATAAFL